MTGQFSVLRLKEILRDAKEVREGERITKIMLVTPGGVCTELYDQQMLIYEVER